MKLPEGAVVHITDAEYLSQYRIRLSFSDGFQNLVDFQPFLESSRNPMIRAHLDPERFAGFVVQDGDLVWGGYDLCFPIADLYENQIQEAQGDRARGGGRRVLGGGPGDTRVCYAGRNLGRTAG